VISVIIGLPLFITGVDLPDVVDSAVGYVASLNTPLAMIFFGTYIANTDLKTMFKVKENYIVAVLKLIAVPAIMLGAFKIFGLAGTMITACIISAAVPSANNTVMFSAKYGNDTGVASKVVTFNSVLSVLTIPVMVALSKMI
jgi:predicted permease